ncbi:MAG TPA: dihydroneopterin aldolase [Aliiroseovarius sp.]|nr:dihydroneopterin aldolase [Aliiroseovarius sp.]
MSSDETSRAFAHPLERARAMAGDTGRVPDRISLRDHVVAVEIGAFQSERGVTQRLAFNVVVEVTPPDGPVEDDVDRILSYDRVTEAIATELAARRFDLLETLAENIAARILREPQAERVFIRIEKLDRGPGALGVEIVRGGAPQRSVQPDADPAPAPLVVFLPAKAHLSPALPGFLDLLQASGQPALLTTGAPAGPVPPAATAPARTQIGLLAADQAAWQVASADARLGVVASRTEIDWALGQRRLAVWAPSRLVLRAAHPPAPATDAAARTLWLAQMLGSPAVLTLGAPLPETPEAPGIRQIAASLTDTRLPKLP